MKRKLVFTAVDITGVRFGRLLVIRRLKRYYLDSNRGVKWVCLCDCSKKKIIDARSLRSGATRSCGCLQKEIVTKHGLWKRKELRPTYATWIDMKTRCLNKNANRYEDWGGRGIYICKRWLDFENFFEDMGMRPEGLSIERMDNDGPYAPWNCKWATGSEQQKNKRPTKRKEKL